MRSIISIFVLSLWLITGISNGQDITNTLAPNGSFKIKDGSTDYLSLSQSTGFLSLNRSLVLPIASSPSLGVIFKGADRFLHNYGSSNTFLGINSGNFTITGSSNTAVGTSTLQSNTTGSSNSAFGSGALFNNSSGSFNSAFGHLALVNNQSADDNSAFGKSTLRYNETGSSNSAFGSNALESNLTGNSNSAFGTYALFVNSTGSFNSAFGTNVLFTNSTGIYNSAFGYQTLYSNSTGYANSAFGTYALNSNSTGYKNSSFGYRALSQNQTGTRNTSVGYKSLYSNTSGFQNTAVGDSALYNNSGNYNTALGYNAGSNVTTGANLTLIGIDANPSSPTAVDQITLGNQFVSSLRCNVQTITSLSDARDKKNITDLTLGLDFITKLKPRQFNWDKREWYDENNSDGSKMKEDPTAGFIAQEFDEIQKSENAEWLNLVLKDNPEKWEATYGNLLPVVVKAIQELNEKNEKLEIRNEKEISRLTDENLKLKSNLESLMSIKEELTKIESLKEELIQQINELKSVRTEYENKFSSLENRRNQK